MINEFEAEMYEEPELTEGECRRGDVHEWLIAVDVWGAISILQHPNIDQWYLDTKCAEEIGLPFDVDWKPGVYRVTTEFECSCTPPSMWSDNYDYEYEFIIKSHERVWSVSNDESEERV